VSASGRYPPAINAELDAELEACLRAVELEYLLVRGRAWDQVGRGREGRNNGSRVWLIRPGPGGLSFCLVYLSLLDLEGAGLGV
jgi:hypothetical protein